MKIMQYVCDVLTNYKIYAVLAIVFLILGCGRTYINFTGIISRYFKNFIFKNKSIISTVFVFPLFLAVAVNLKKRIDGDLLELITVVISILMSLFFIYLSFFQNYEDKINDTKNYNLKEQKKEYVQETKAVASYEVFLSIVILISCFSYSLFGEDIQKIYSGIIYFLFFHLLINLLVLLKRYDSKI